MLTNLAICILYFCIIVFLTLSAFLIYKAKIKVMTIKQYFILSILKGIALMSIVIIDVYYIVKIIKHILL